MRSVRSAKLLRSSLLSTPWRDFPSYNRARIPRGTHPRRGASRRRSHNRSFRNARPLPRIAPGAQHRRVRRPCPETGCGDSFGPEPARLDKDRPARPQPAQGIVEPCCRADELGRRGAVEVGATEPRRTLKRTILVEHDPRRDQRRPGEKIGETLRLFAIFGDVQHRLIPQNARGSADDGAPRRRIAHPASRPRRPPHGRSLK
jgi:hypothetical protein